MSLFDLPEYDGHQSVHFHEDAHTGLKAIVAVHRRWELPAVGGCRFWAYESADAALRDVLRLSRGMTYKNMMAQVDYGGGKCVIIRPPKIRDRAALFAAMGDFVESLNGVIKTGMDVGLSAEDVAAMAGRCSHIVGRGAFDPAKLTAYGVFGAIRTALAHLDGGEELAGRRIAVQGLGKVGMQLCRHLADAGARLTVADVDAQRVAAAQEAFDAQAADPDRIHAVAADVFSPCALGGVISAATVGELKVRAVVGAANNQLSDDALGTALAARGILYAPDYVANAGGLIAVIQDLEGLDRAEVERRMDLIGSSLADVFRQAERRRISTVEAANRIARKRIAELDAAGRLAA